MHSLCYYYKIPHPRSIVSPTIFAIAAIPAAVVYFVGLLSKSRLKTLLSAVAMVLLGLVTGSAGYIVADLFFVALAYLWTSENFITTVSRVDSTEFRPSPRAVVRAGTDAENNTKNVPFTPVIAVVTIAALVFILGYFFNSYNSTKTTEDPTVLNRSVASASSLQNDEASVASSAAIARLEYRPEESAFAESDDDRSLREYPPMFPTRQPTVTESVATKRTSADGRPSSTPWLTGGVASGKETANTPVGYRCMTKSGKAGIGTGRLSKDNEYSPFLRRMVQTGEYVIFKFDNKGREYWFSTSNCTRT